MYMTIGSFIKPGEIFLDGRGRKHEVLAIEGEYMRVKMGEEVFNVHRSGTFRMYEQK